MVVERVKKRVQQRRFILIEWIHYLPNGRIQFASSRNKKQVLNEKKKQYLDRIDRFPCSCLREPSRTDWLHVQNSEMHCVNLRPPLRIV